MKKRTVSAILLLTLLIGSFILGYQAFAILMTIVTVLGYRELVNIKYGVKENNIEVIRFIGYISVIFITLNNIFYTVSERSSMIFIILALTIPIVFYNDSKKYNINDALYFIGVVFFLGYAFNNLIYLDKINIYKCILIFIIAFATDTYAFIGGLLIGRHKLTSISPKKTVEGFAVGTVMGTLISSVYYYLLIGGINISTIIITCFILVILSAIGDLVFSSIKRYFNKKDYSNLIPGHGGILDRFDSVIFVSLGLTALLMFI